jgi:hypothetical protein
MLEGMSQMTLYTQEQKYSPHVSGCPRITSDVALTVQLVHV